MGSLRKRGRDLSVVAVILAILAALAIAGAAGSASDPKAAPRNGVISQRFGFSGSLPDGWSRSAERLVPLLLPREVLSIGTAPMPVGGGGNCGREPVAAIARMRTGDALISIQEYAVTPRMPSRLNETYPLLSTYSSANRIDLRRELRAPGTRIPASRSLWSATLPFREHQRVFDALVYLKGPPTPERVKQITSVLGGLDFRSGDYVDRPGSARDRAGAGAS